MAGGDLLYIFAFIILPTAVLVSCIWALVMLRKGVLLPERPAGARDARDGAIAGPPAPLDESNPVEETGEHIIVEPATPVHTQAAAASAGLPANQAPSVPPPASAGPVPAPAPSDEPPTVEETQELAVVPLDADPVDDVERAGASAPSGPTATESVAAPAADQVADRPDLMMVPLEDLPGISHLEDGAKSNAATPPAIATTPRRPARRVAQRRPTEAEPSRARPRAGQRRGSRKGSEE